MLRAVVKTTGYFIDKPRLSSILIENEDEIAIRRKNPETNKIEQFTIRELFDSFSKNSSYVRNEGDKEQPITPDLFPTWFNNRYVRGKPIESSLIDIKYERI